jgi:hypothetical protein
VVPPALGLVVDPVPDGLLVDVVGLLALLLLAVPLLDGVPLLGFTVVLLLDAVPAAGCDD